MPADRGFAFIAEDATQWLPEAERDAIALSVRAALSQRG
jgi:hypothetical protein